jgi:hypothetical protein
LRLFFKRLGSSSWLALKHTPCTLVVFSEGVAGSQEKYRFDDDEFGIGPVDLAGGLDADSMAEIRDYGGHEPVRVKLVVPVVDFNQQVEGIYFAGKL